MSSAANLYHSVISDVISSVRDSFLDESVDENVLQELKQLWTQKLEQSKTIEPRQVAPAPNHHSLDAKPPMGAGAAMAGRHVIRGGGAAVARSGGAAVVGAAIPRPGGTAVAAAAPTQPPAAAASSSNQLVITDPDRLVPVQITIPAQPGNPTSRPRALTVNVPAHSLQQSGATSALLQTVLTQAITQALSLPESHAQIYLQNQINHAFKL